MDPQDAIRIILNEAEGALDAIAMDDIISRTIRDEEESIKSMTGVEVVNEAYREAFSRDVRICMFCDRRMATHDDSTMVLEDLEGNVLGMTLNEEMVPEYQGRSDVVWVSDDFIIFPYVEPRGGERFILKPMKFPVLSEKEGYYDVVMCSPAPSSDVRLKKYYNKSLNEETATLIVGYNHLNRTIP